MTLKDRKIKQRAELRRQILKTTTAIAEKEGWQAVTMRRLANEVDYTPPTIYELFGSKQGVFLAVISSGFEELGTRFANIDPKLSPEERLRAMGHAYWQFSHDHPTSYQAMFGI